MIGKLNWPGRLATVPPMASRPAILAGIVVLAIGTAAAAAWLTQPPETAPPRIAKAGKARRAIVEAPVPPALVPAPAASPLAAAAAIIALPDTPAAPLPTSADIARSATPPAAPDSTTASAAAPAAVDWTTIPLDELRAKANANDVTAMEELARRLVQGVGVTKDQQAGAGWLLRAAQRGSAQSAFNVAVMYERGFVVERDSTKAVEWYRKAVAANLAMAKHNLALLLRDGKGAPRDGKTAVELLRSAAHQGMSASMFTLGDIYERGDAAPKDASAAMAWFAITAEFERQTNRGTETALGKTASQRTQTLQRILTPGELEQAQQLGQSEFKLIVETLSPPKPPSAPTLAPPVETITPLPTLPPLADIDPPGWPKTANDQVRVIQQALVDLRLLRDKPDGAIGPMTRNAIRSFQRSIALRETGEPTKDVYAALKEALGSRDIVANSPLPLPAKVDPPKAEAPKVEAASAETASTEAAKAEAAKAEAEKAEAAKAEAAKAEAAKAEVAKAEAAKAEAAKAEIAKIEAAKVEAAKAEAAKIEAAKAEAAKAEAAKAEAMKAEAAKIGAAKAEAARAEAAKAEAAKLEAARLEAAKVEAAKGEAAKVEAAKAEAAKAEAAKVDPPKPALPTVETAKPPSTQVAAVAEPPKSDTAKAETTKPETSKPEPPPAVIDLGQPPPAPPPPTSADIARATPKVEPPKPPADSWPETTADQVKVVQKLLRELHFSRDAPDGLNGPGTRAAIRDYERAAGLPVTGEPSKALFESLKELRLLMAPKPN
jgi:peptidoglycan hydrolase-like protein with peptidoglycan-binding domain